MSSILDTDHVVRHHFVRLLGDGSHRGSISLWLGRCQASQLLATPVLRNPAPQTRQRGKRLFAGVVGQALSLLLSLFLHNLLLLKSCLHSLLPFHLLNGSPLFLGFHLFDPFNSIDPWILPVSIKRLPEMIGNLHFNAFVLECD